MKLGVIISTNEPETVWNAFRLGNLALKEINEVNIFLINRGVEIEGINNPVFNLKGQINSFIENKGKILACGTCLKSRQKQGSETCPVSTMKDLLKMIEDSDKILTFS